MAASVAICLKLYRLAASAFKVRPIILTLKSEEPASRDRCSCSSFARHSGSPLPSSHCTRPELISARRLRRSRARRLPPGSRSWCSKSSTMIVRCCVARRRVPPIWRHRSKPHRQRAHVSHPSTSPCRFRRRTERPRSPDRDRPGWVKPGVASLPPTLLQLAGGLWLSRRCAAPCLRLLFLPNHRCA